MVAPDAFAGIHGYFYLIIAAFCLFSAGLAHFYYVETAGHTLEEIAVAFGDQAFADGDREVMDVVDLKEGFFEKEKRRVSTSTYHHTANAGKMSA